MDVDDAKILEEAKAILKEIMDPSPDPKKEQIEIWKEWFDRMADGQPVYRTPDIASEAYAAGRPFPLDLSPPEAVPHWIPQRRKWFAFRFRFWR